MIPKFTVHFVWSAWPQASQIIMDLPDVSVKSKLNTSKVAAFKYLEIDDLLFVCSCFLLS